MKASSCQRHALLGCLVLAVALLQQVAWAAKDCAVTNRGWLTSGADRGVHPTGLFGPLGLHGEHKMNNDFSNSGIQIRVAEVTSPICLSCPAMDWAGPSCKGLGNPYPERLNL